jgi:dienelactone hydrolase
MIASCNCTHVSAYRIRRFPRPWYLSITAIDMDATVDFLTRQPEVKPSDVIVVGQSAGGWGAIAYASSLHPKVEAFVVMAGGRGGHRD